MPPDLVGKDRRRPAQGGPDHGPRAHRRPAGSSPRTRPRYYLAKLVVLGRWCRPSTPGSLIDDLGNEPAPGPEVTGRLCVKGPASPAGYPNRPDAIGRGGDRRRPVFDTGDVARIDEVTGSCSSRRPGEGHAVLRGRGERVTASEVERRDLRTPRTRPRSPVSASPTKRLRGGGGGCGGVACDGKRRSDADGLRAFLDGPDRRPQDPGSTTRFRHRGVAPQRHRQVPRATSATNCWPGPTDPTGSPPQRRPRPQGHDAVTVAPSVGFQRIVRASNVWARPSVPSRRAGPVG